MIFFGIKLYTVHVKPEDGPHKKPVFVREGFNIYAFLFSGLWALYKRLWMPLLAIILFNGLLGFILQYHLLTKPSFAVVQFAFNLMVGYLGNDWVRNRLSRQGYIIADISAADSLLRAEQRYFERTLDPSLA